MLCSGNDAAVAIAEHIGGSVEGFADIMNQKADSLGLKNTNFVTPHGLDNVNHYTTAYELSLITRYALNIPEISNIVRTKNTTVMINGYPKNIHNSNELLEILNGVNGVKTGFTNNAGRCLVTSVSRNEFDIICIVLGADTKKMRTKDSISLIEYCYKKYELVNIENILKRDFEEWIKLNKITVNKGKNDDVKLDVEELTYKILPIDKNKIKDIESEIQIDKYVEAPILQGQKLGRINIKIDDEILCGTNVIISKEIVKKEPADYFFYILINMKEILEKPI